MRTLRCLDGSALTVVPVAAVDRGGAPFEVTLELRRDGADPMAIRLALLSQHYRDDWSWTPDLLTEGTARLARWREAVRQKTGAPAAGTVADIRAALRTDLDARTALAAVDAWVAAEGSDRFLRAPPRPRQVVTQVGSTPPGT